MPSIITVGGSSSTGNGTTFGDVIEKVYRRVMGGTRERVVQLVNAIGSDDVTFQITSQQAAQVAPGVIIAVDLEVMYVTSFDTTVNTVTVIRGYYGSIATTHAANTLGYLNPRYSRYDIGVAINDDLRSLSSPSNGLFRVGVAEITYNPVFAGYDLGDLPANFIDILEVRYRIAPPYRTFPAIKSWKVVRWQQNSTDPVFPSGLGLIIREAGWPGLPIYVTYSAPFISLVDTSDSLVNTPGTNDEAPPFNGYSSEVAATFTGTTTNGGTTITSVSNTSGLYTGMALAGTGITIGTTITGISVSSRSITISTPSTANGTVTIQAADTPNIPNMTPTMLDLPALGAEIDLTLPREISRNFMESQPDPRKAQEVMPNAIAGSVNALMARRQARINEEADRLSRQYTKVRGF